jgi:aminoglycoside 2'-N-acetyltransferase I
VAMAELQTAHTAELEAATLTAARAHLYDVFDDMTDHDWEHALVLQQRAVIGVVP